FAGQHGDDVLDRLLRREVPLPWVLGRGVHTLSPLERCLTECGKGVEDEDGFLSPLGRGTVVLPLVEVLERVDERLWRTLHNRSHRRGLVLVADGYVADFGKVALLLPGMLHKGVKAVVHVQDAHVVPVREERNEGAGLAGTAVAD